MIKAYIAITVVQLVMFTMYLLKGISFAGQISDKIFFGLGSY